MNLPRPEFSLCESGVVNQKKHVFCIFPILYLNFGYQKTLDDEKKKVKKKREKREFFFLMEGKKDCYPANKACPLFSNILCCTLL